MLSLAPPSFVTVFIPRSSPAESTESSLVMAKGKRGVKFTIAELESLLDVINENVPIGIPDWERVWDKHDSTFPKKERTVELLKRKFQGLARHEIPTGDPACPPHIRNAEGIYRKIVLAIDGSTGGSDVSDDEGESTQRKTMEATRRRRRSRRKVMGLTLPLTSPLTTSRSRKKRSQKRSRKRSLQQLGGRL